jgi:Protein of unknown function (DUF1236)
MRTLRAIPIALATIMLGCSVGLPYAVAQSGNAAGGTGDAGVSGAIEQKLLLSQAQRSAVYQEVSKDKSKAAPKDFSPVIGADVPPMIELYALPDDALADSPAAKLYKYTMVENKVVVVDPTKMRVIDVIGPSPQQ